MFYGEINGIAAGMESDLRATFDSRLSRGFEFISEPEEVLIGVTAPASGQDERYDDMKRKVDNWESIRSAKSLGLRSAVLVRNGIETGEKGLAQCQTPLR